MSPLDAALRWHPDQYLFAPLADAVGLPIDQVRLLTCLFLSFPIGAVHRHVPRGAARYAHALLWGVLMGWACFKWDIAHTFVSAAVAYALMRGRRALPVPFATATFVWAFGYLSWAWIGAMRHEYGKWTMDWTCPQMLLTLKVVHVAMNVRDGEQPERCGSRRSSNRAEKLDAAPSPLAYFSYIFFFPTFTAGPIFSFKAYQQFSEVDLSTEPMRRRMRSRWCFVAWKMAGAVCLLVPTLLGFSYRVEDVIEPEFLERAFPFRVAYTWMVVSLARSRYFLFWYITDAACICTGFGWNPCAEPLARRRSLLSRALGNMFYVAADADGMRWDRCSNGQYLKVELAQNSHDIMTHWNTGVDNWLRQCVYFRRWDLGFLGVHDHSVALTGLVSCVWHGFYPGYYLFFFFATVYTTTGRAFRRAVRPWVMSLSNGAAWYAPLVKPAYDAVTMIATCALLNCLGAAFLLIDLERAWKALRATNFVGVIAPVVGFAVLRAGVVPRLPAKREEQRAERGRAAGVAPSLNNTA